MWQQSRRRSLFRAKLLCLVLAVLVLGTFPVTPVAAATLTFSGHVYEGYQPDTSRPLSGVQVRVYEERWYLTANLPNASKITLATGTTDPSGYYLLTVYTADKFLVYGTTDSSGYYSPTVTVPSDPIYSILELSPSQGYAITAVSPVRGTSLSDKSVGFLSPVSPGTGADFWVIPALPPDAGFSITSTGGDTAPVIYTFTDTSANYPDSWSWDFGDGVQSVQKNPSHSFTAPGDYTVTLLVSNTYGNDSVTQTLIVPPRGGTIHADFSASPVVGQVPLTVRFTDTSTGNPTRRSWDFNNDGNSDSSSLNPDYTYNSAGTYSVRLDVYDQSGRSDTVVKASLVTVREITGTVTTTVTPVTGRTTIVVSPCTVFFLPCETVGIVFIIVIVVTAAGAALSHNFGGDGGQPDPGPPEKPEGPGTDKPPDTGVRPDPQTNIDLEVQRGIEVHGMDFPDSSIRLETEAGIECPEDGEGKGG